MAGQPQAALMGKLYDDYFVKPQRRPSVTPVTKTVTAMAKLLPKVGRPRKANKLTAAEKQKAYRERKRG